MTKTEDALYNVLERLPEVDHCCFVVFDIRRAAMICSVLLFILNLPFFYMPFYFLPYHHQSTAIAIIQAIFYYITVVFHMFSIVLNILFWFSFLVEMIPLPGLLFVLVSLMAAAFHVVWVIIALIRSTFNPGLNPKSVYLQHICGDLSWLHRYNPQCLKTQYSDAYLAYYLIPAALAIYLIIVINSYVFHRQEVDAQR